MNGLRDLFLNSLQIEGCWFLHWWKFNEAFSDLAHDLLYKDEAPKLVSKPLIVVDGSAYAGSFEGVQANVGQDRPVRFHCATKPTVGLINEPILVIVDPYGAERRLCEVQDLAPLGRAFARNEIGLVVAVQMHFVCPFAELRTFFQLFNDVWVARSRDKSRKPI